MILAVLALHWLSLTLCLHHLNLAGVDAFVFFIFFENKLQLYPHVLSPSTSCFVICNFPRLHMSLTL